MYSCFTSSRFKWLLVEVLAEIGLKILYKDGTMFSHVWAEWTNDILDKFDWSSFRDTRKTMKSSIKFSICE